MKKRIIILALSIATYSMNGHAAVGLDRTRVIVKGDKSTEVVSIHNTNLHDPYLAQSWIEDSHGMKIEGPLVATPPLQRLEANEKSLIKISPTTLAEIQKLPQDRESLFYFNVREIPPKSDKPNTLQIALQSKVKLFYRPKALVPDINQLESPWQEKLTLVAKNNVYTINNPTGYFITIVDAKSAENNKTVANFKSFMIAPKSSMNMNVLVSNLGISPVLTYINDYGGQPKLTFKCAANECNVIKNKVK